MIKLTSSFDGKDIYIREEHITAILEREKGNAQVDTVDSYYLVEESVSEILEKIEKAKGEMCPPRNG